MTTAVNEAVLHKLITTPHEAQEKLPRSGNATVGTFGDLREQTLFAHAPLPGRKASFIGMNWKKPSDRLFEWLRASFAADIERGIEEYVVIELLSLLSHSERMKRVANVPEHRGIVNESDLLPSAWRYYTKSSETRIFGPGEEQFRYAYCRAVEDHFDTVAEAWRFFEWCQAQDIACVIQFVDRIDRPEVYSSYKAIDGSVREVVAQGIFSSGIVDVENFGYLTTDPRAIKAVETDILARQFSRKPALDQMLDAASPAQRSAAKAEIELLFKGTRFDEAWWKF